MVREGNVMARYRELSTEQLIDFSMLLMLLSHADQHLQEWMPEDRKIKLKQASKLITDVVVDTTQELSQAAAVRLKKNIDNVKLFCLPKPEAERKVRESRKINTMRLREEAFFILLESSLQHCKHPCGRNYKACTLRKILLEVDAPKWDPDAKGFCPYEQRRDPIVEE
jgi:hypothetical protein